MTHEHTEDCIRLPTFPLCPENRPGLSQIAYRIGSYAQIREAMLHRLNREPVLSGWTHRDSDDPGIALLEGAAILGDILTFYQELYANEAYLRTAKWRESIADLVRLSGYRLAPGIGGRGTFAFEVRGDAPVVVPPGFAISAQVTGLEDEAEFQTIAELKAYPWLSRFNLYRPSASPVMTATTEELMLTGPDATDPPAIEAGDRILLGPMDSSGSLAGAEIVVVDEVRQRHGETLYRLKTPLQRSVPALTLGGFKIGRSFRHFGHNAPPTIVTLDGDTATQDSISYSRSMNDFSTVPEPALSALEFPLDTRVDDLPAGVTLVCEVTPWPNDTTVLLINLPVRQTVIRTVTNVRQGSLTWGALTGATTVVTLSTGLTSGNPIFLDIRMLQFHETLSPLLSFAARRDATSAVRGNSLSFFATAAEASALKGRLLLLSEPDAEPEPLRVQSVTPASGPDRPQLQTLVLEKEVDYAAFPLEGPAVTVYGNLVEATQGKAEREAVLGNGDNREAFQTFRLPKSPLTYLNVPGETPPQTPELEVYVAERRWKRVDTLFNSRPKSEHYIVREDANGASWVQFGDGKTGARLPSGVDNVVARLRTGVGAFGALKEGTKAQAAGRLDRLDQIQLPGVVSGGEQPEPGDVARVAAPGKIQALDRLVSLADFESEALTIAGVSRATAAWRLVDGVPAVVITVLMDTGRDAEIDAVRSIVAADNRKRGPARFPVIVNAGYREYFCLAVSIGIDAALREETVLAAVRSTLGVAGVSGSDADGTGGRCFGEQVHATYLEGVIQNVPGVRWVRVTGLVALGPAEDPADLSLPTGIWALQTPLAPAPDAILALHGDHLRFQPTPVASTEEAES